MFLKQLVRSNADAVLAAKPEREDRPELGVHFFQEGRQIASSPHFIQVTMSEERKAYIYSGTLGEYELKNSVSAMEMFKIGKIR